ncbi:MAG: DNA cytosine methyltransferase [Desulfurivibrio sp.]|nr:DNA cytosine methyltransferase [Desulfurivibrio sp.]
MPVIDLFAGPGGLAEGFSAFHDAGANVFRICLSVEKDRYAHSTLELRSFFRQFPRKQVPEEYYSYLRKEISREKLLAACPEEAGRAKPEAWAG